MKHHYSTFFNSILIPSYICFYYECLYICRISWCLILQKLTFCYVSWDRIAIQLECDHQNIMSYLLGKWSPKIALVRQDKCLCPYLLSATWIIGICFMWWYYTFYSLHLGLVTHYNYPGEGEQKQGFIYLYMVNICPNSAK